MTFELSNFDVMEHLWATLDKTEDGSHIRYNAADIEQLWWMGFADSNQITLEAWKNVFEPHHQADGSFLLGKDDFLSLDKYRFKGEIRVPFDAMLINEGRYTDEGLDELVNASIAPSCSLSPSGLKDFFNALKKDFREKDSLILIKKPAKERIKALLDAHPSPLRNLEIILDQMIEQKGAELEKEIDEAQTAAATTEAAMQASRFSIEPTSTVEAKARGFKDITKTRKTAGPAEVKGVDKVELKKIKRSRKGMRG